MDAQMKALFSKRSGDRHDEHEPGRKTELLDHNHNTRRAGTEPQAGRDQRDERLRIIEARHDRTAKGGAGKSDAARNGREVPDCWVCSCIAVSPLLACAGETSHRPAHAGPPYTWSWLRRPN